MTDEFRYAFRAAGWVPTGDQDYRTRLTSQDQAHLPEADLVAAGAEAARAKDLSNGKVVVGFWTNIDHYIEPPKFDVSLPGPLDDMVEDEAEFALQSVLQIHSGGDEPALSDAAHWAARGILFDLSGRRGFEVLDGDLEDEVLKEIVTVLAAIVRRAMSPRHTAGGHSSD